MKLEEAIVYLLASSMKWLHVNCRDSVAAICSAYIPSSSQDAAILAMASDLVLFLYRPKVFQPS